MGRLYTTSGMAAQLGISHQSVNALIARGSVIGIKAIDGRGRERLVAIPDDEIARHRRRRQQQGLE